MIAIDTSVAVPALSAGHPDHRDAHAVVAAQRPSLPAHAAIETYAVLTRLPAPAYDALIAATARAADATLVTGDRRAATTYAKLGVDVRLLG